MSLDKEKNCGCNSEDDHGCGCGSDHGHDHDDCDCGHDDCEDGCGCGEHETLTLTLDDGEELECPIIDAFEVNEQHYIALLHPEDENVLLYRYFDNDDDSIDLETIDDDDEFDLVSKTFLSLQED